MLREALRVLGWVTCSVLLVLLVPSSAWSDDTGSPPSSPSSSPSDGSSSPANPQEPSPSDSPEATPTPDPTAEPSPSEGATTPPGPTLEQIEETVQLAVEESMEEPVEEPTPTDPAPLCTKDTPCVMEPSKSYVNFLLLTSGVSMLSLLGLLVGSFGRR